MSAHRDISWGKLLKEKKSPFDFKKHIPRTWHQANNGSQARASLASVPCRNPIEEATWLVSAGSLLHMPLDNVVCRAIWLWP